MAISSSSIISSLSSVGSCLTPGSCLTTAPGSVFTCADSNLTNGDCQQVSVLQSGHTYLKGVHLVYLLILYLNILLIHSTGKKTAYRVWAQDGTQNFILEIPVFGQKLLGHKNVKKTNLRPMNLEKNFGTQKCLT